MTEQQTNGILEEFRIDFVDFWNRLPNKGFFLSLLGAWFLLFMLLGNSTLGYIHSPSLFKWLQDAYHPAAATFGDYFDTEDGMLGMLVPFVVVGIFWWKRKELVAAPLDLWWPGMAIVGFSLLLHVLGYLIQQPKISLIAFFGGVYGLMGVAWGYEWLKRSFFPFILLAFCVPISAQLQPFTFQLRLLVSKMVEAICNSFVLPLGIIRDGTALRDPSGLYQYEIAAACSGIRSLNATVGLALCFAFLSVGGWWKRVLLISSAVPLAIIGNLLRMLMIVLAAEIGGQDAGNWVHEGGPGGIVSLIPYVPPLFGLAYFEQWLRRFPDRLPFPQPGTQSP